MNWIIYGAEKPFRIGFQTGYGMSSYAASETYNSESGDYTKEWSTSGPVSLVGFYLDWGGRLFGTRLGYSYTKPKYPKLEINDSTCYEVTGTGHALMLDFRWAF